MCLHCALYALLESFVVFLATDSVSNALISFFIFLVSHYFANRISGKLIKNKKYQPVVVHSICQLIEMLILLLVFFFFVYNHISGKRIDPFLKEILKKAILYFTAFASLTKPISYLIQEIFNALLKKKETDFAKNYEPEQIDGAGNIIGILERFILFIFFINNQASAIGFIIAAKSVARFKKIETVQGFAEKYLIGTLMSSGAAVIIGWLVTFALKII